MRFVISSSVLSALVKADGGLFGSMAPHSGPRHPPLTTKVAKDGTQMVLLRSRENPTQMRWQRIDHGVDGGPPPEAARQVLREANRPGGLALTRARLENPDVHALVARGFLTVKPAPLHYLAEFQAEITRSGREWIEHFDQLARARAAGEQQSLFKARLGLRLSRLWALLKAQQLRLFGDAVHVAPHVAHNPGGHGTHLVVAHQRHIDTHPNLPPATPTPTTRSSTPAEHAAGLSFSSQHTSPPAHVAIEPGAVLVAPAVEITLPERVEDSKAPVAARRGKTYHELGSSPGEWRPADVEGFAEATNAKGEIVGMPVFDIPEGYQPVKTRFSGGGHDDGACELCGTPIKNVAYIVNDKRKLSMIVGNKCVESHADALMPGAAKLAQKTFSTRLKAEEIAPTNELIQAGVPASIAAARVRARLSAAERVDKAMPPPTEAQHTFWEQTRARVAAITRRRAAGEFLPRGDYDFAYGSGHDRHFRSFMEPKSPQMLADEIRERAGIDPRGIRRSQEKAGRPVWPEGWDADARAKLEELEGMAAWPEPGHEGKALDLHAVRDAFFPHLGIADLHHPVSRRMVPDWAEIGRSLDETRAIKRQEAADKAERKVVLETHPETVRLAALRDKAAAAEPWTDEEQAWVSAELATLPAHLRPKGTARLRTIDALTARLDERIRLEPLRKGRTIKNKPGLHLDPTVHRWVLDNNEVMTAWDAKRDEIEREHGLDRLWTSKHPSERAISLSQIRVAPEHRGQGRADRAMLAMTSWADQHGVRIALTPDDTLGSSKAKLERWYKKHGFKPNTGRTRDFAFRETMLRTPAEPMEKGRFTIGQLHAAAQARHPELKAVPPAKHVRYHHPDTGEERTGQVISGGQHGITVADHETGHTAKVHHGHYVVADEPPKPGQGGAKGGKPGDAAEPRKLRADTRDASGRSLHDRLEEVGRRLPDYRAAVAVHRRVRGSAAAGRAEEADAAEKGLGKVSPETEEYIGRHLGGDVGVDDLRAFRASRLFAEHAAEHGDERAAAEHVSKELGAGRRARRAHYAVHGDPHQLDGELAAKHGGKVTMHGPGRAVGFHREADRDAYVKAANGAKKLPAGHHPQADVEDVHDAEPVLDQHVAPSVVAAHRAGKRMGKAKPDDTEAVRERRFAEHLGKIGGASGQAKPAMRKGRRFMVAPATLRKAAQLGLFGGETFVEARRRGGRSAPDPRQGSLFAATGGLAKPGASGYATPYPTGPGVTMSQPPPSPPRAAPHPPEGYLPIPGSKHGGYRLYVVGGNHRYWYPDEPSSTPLEPRVEYHDLGHDPRLWRDANIKNQLVKWDVSQVPHTSTWPDRRGKYRIPEHHVADVHAMLAAPASTESVPASPAPPAPPAPAVTEERMVPLGHPKTYDFRAEIKAAGGRWDAARKVWNVPASKHAGLMAAMNVAASTAAPRVAAAHTVTVGSIHRGGLPSVGAMHTHGGKPYVITAVKNVRATDDGASFDQPFQSGVIADAELRELTPDESSRVAAEEVTKAAQKAAAEKISAAWRAFSSAPKERAAPPEGASLIAGGAHYDAPSLYTHNGHFYLVIYNGRDGDDWSASNFGNSVSLRGDLTPDLRDQLAVIAPPPPPLPSTGTTVLYRDPVHAVLSYEQWKNDDTQEFNKLWERPLRWVSGNRFEIVNMDDAKGMGDAMVTWGDKLVASNSDAFSKSKRAGRDRARGQLVSDAGKAILSAVAAAARPVSPEAGLYSMNEPGGV